MKQRSPSRAPLSGDSILRLAVGKEPSDVELDPGEAELLALVREVIAEGERTTDEKAVGVIEVIALKIGETVKALASTLHFSQAQFATVRSSADTAAIEGRTEFGTRVMVAPVVSGGPELILSWDDDAPSRATLKHEGALVESAPVEANRVVFTIKKGGLYTLSTKRMGKVLERFSLSIELT